jgi:hypothetical protein
VVLSFRARSFLLAGWKPIEQRVPVTWTNCHFGGRRPWFICSVRTNGQHCGRLLYLGGDSFACRKCCGLAYERQGGLQCRNLRKAQSIRLRLGGAARTPSRLFPPSPAACKADLSASRRKADLLACRSLDFRHDLRIRQTRDVTQAFCQR